MGAFSAGLLLLAVSSAAPLTDGEVWNEGVAAYEAGDVTNALRSLNALLLSPSHGARAAELAAKIEFDRGNMEAAADLAQKSLRASPSDARRRRNFMRAAGPLPRLREQARLEKALKAAEGKDPASLLQGARLVARDLFNESSTYRTNAAEKVVALSDSLAARADSISLTYLGVREALARSVTNEEEAVTFLAQLDEAEKKTREAAESFSTLSDEAYDLSSHVEDDLTRFYKRLVLPPSAMGEGLSCQSNAYLDVASFNGRPWQEEALDYTRSFRAKFPAWARAYEEAAQSDTNKPPFTAETQAKISALATELEKIQLSCVEKSVPADQQAACRIAEEILGLLPKDENSGGGGASSSPPPPSEDGEKGEDEKNDPPPPENEPQTNETQDQEPEADESEQDEGAGADESEAPSPEESAIDALLKKAQERSDEHEAEKKARQRHVPLPPNERDW